MKNILFVASECVPFVKTGGLADVVGALPKSLDRTKYDVRVILPDYASIPAKYRSQFRYIHHFYMDLGRLGNVYVGIMTYEMDGITYYFIDNEHYFSGEKPYGDIHWDIEKFCYFSKAALAILPVIDFHPDIIHCHDWQTGVVTGVPAYAVQTQPVLSGHSHDHDHSQPEIPGCMGHPDLETVHRPARLCLPARPHGI